MQCATFGACATCWPPLLYGDLVPLQTKDTIVYYTMCATEQDEHSDMEDLMNMEADEDETHNTEQIRRLYICPVVP